jgi:hypothetical protein
VSQRHRLDDLLGMTVRFRDTSLERQVIDVRLAPSSRVPGPLAELVVSGMIVGSQRPGTLFGYDRHPHQGPWLIRTIVRWLHRNSGFVEWADVESIDWHGRVVTVRADRPRAL